MRQAIDMAKQGLGKTYPNPAVGCVIVKEGKASFYSKLNNSVTPC